MDKITKREVIETLSESGGGDKYEKYVGEILGSEEFKGLLKKGIKYLTVKIRQSKEGGNPQTPNEDYVNPNKEPQANSQGEPQNTKTQMERIRKLLNSLPDDVTIKELREDFEENEELIKQQLESGGFDVV